jgi:hypothetical protein
MSMPVNPFRIRGSAQLSRKQHGGREIESLLAMNKRTEKTKEYRKAGNAAVAATSSRALRMDGSNGLRAKMSVVHG